MTMSQGPSNSRGGKGAGWRGRYTRGGGRGWGRPRGRGTHRDYAYSGYRRGKGQKSGEVNRVPSRGVNHGSNGTDCSYM